MDDDSALFNILAGLVILAGVVYLVYLFVVYVLPWIVFVAGIVGFPGWSLYRTLASHRFQLTARSVLALFLGVGVLAWSFSTVVVIVAELHVIFAAILGASAYFFGCLLLVYTWGLCRWAAVRRHVAAAVRQEAAMKQRVQALEAEQAHLEPHVSLTEQASADHRSRSEALGAEIESLCAQAPRTMGVVRQGCLIQLRTSPTPQLRSVLAGSQQTIASPSDRLALLLAEQELLGRENALTAETLHTLQERLEMSVVELEDARQALQRATVARVRSEEVLRVFGTKPILL